MDEKEYNEYANIFVERIRALIGQTSISSFSKQIGIPSRTIGDWLLKKGTPRMENLIILAKKFECSVDYLLGLEDEFGNKTY